MSKNENQLPLFDEVVPGQRDALRLMQDMTIEEIFSNKPENEMKIERHIESRTAPRLVPWDGGESLYPDLLALIDDSGEFVDSFEEPSAIRTASFALPRYTGYMQLSEIVDAENLDGENVIHYLRDDFRGRNEAMIRREHGLADTAIRAIKWDMKLYGNRENAELYQRRMASLLNWLVQIPLAVNTLRSTTKRNKTFIENYETVFEEVARKTIAERRRGRKPDRVMIVSKRSGRKVTRTVDTERIRSELAQRDSGGFVTRDMRIHAAAKRVMKDRKNRRGSLKRRT